MRADAGGLDGARRVWPWRLLAAVLIIAVTGLRLAYLAFDCPLDLAPDEAHYWDWSRHLDWSYYSKGPLVACLIRAGCELFGPLSQQLTGSDMLAVRLPAVLCGALLLISLYVLTVQVSRSEPLAAVVVALALTFPVLAAGSSLMTIDAPYCCCWGWALVTGYLAATRPALWTWALTGLLVGFGILAKYTMVLWLPGFLLFLLTNAATRHLPWRLGFWLLLGLAFLGGVPILWWNAHYDWVTFWHVGGQAGLRQTTGLHWLGPLTFLGGQAALLLGFWFVAWLAAVVAYRPWREQDLGRRYLWWMSVPVFAVFFGFSLKNGGGELNWPVTAYLSGLVLTTVWLAEQLKSPCVVWRRCLTVGLCGTCLLGVGLTVLMHYGEKAQPVLSWLSGPPTPTRPLPLRRWDPTCRLRGWRTLAAEVDALRDELRYQGIEPLLAGSNWSLPGLLGFYCSGKPQAYSFGLALGDRHSQYDLWHPNPIADPEQFVGQTFIYVTDHAPVPRAAFERTEPPREVVYRERGQPIARWVVTVCHGYRGFGRPTTQRY